MRLYYTLKFIPCEKKVFITEVWKIRLRIHGVGVGLYKFGNLHIQFWDAVNNIERLREFFTLPFRAPEITPGYTEIMSTFCI